MDKFSVTEIKWNAGRIDRWHAHPTLHPQTVADHTYGVMQWLRCVVPEVALSKNLMLAALDHDVAEYWTGDIPYTAKRMYPDLQKAISEAEIDIHERLNATYNLIKEEMGWLKFADLTEMGFYAIREHTMGNGFMDPVMENIIGDLDRICNDQGTTAGMADILNFFTKELISWREQTTPK